MSNNNGALFADQIARGVFDPWACFGLHADNPSIDLRAVRLHFHKVVMPHVFERGEAGAKTTAHNVPIWSQVNRARDELSSDQRLHASRIPWRFNSVQVWNPYAVPGSAEAKIPLATTASK